MEKLEKTLKSIQPPDSKAAEEAQKWLDNLTKPLGSLGMLEDIGIKMAGITGKVHNKIEKKNIVIMCADNGVFDEGVSGCPQSITALVTNNFTRGITGVCVLSGYESSDITVVDIGVDFDFNNPKILNRKIAYGTKNMAKGPAMTREECIRAIETGIEITDRLVSEGYNLLGTGEMGIGNTTTSTAIISAFSGLDPDIITGRGSGLTDEQYLNKKRVIKKAIEINRPDRDDPLDVMSKVGGFDIAGLCGCFLGAAKNRVPIVIDGLISTAAALCAYKLNPQVKEYIFPSHLSAEPGAAYALQEIGLEPMINLKMRLGEGSGCPLAFNIIGASLEVMNKMGTFDEAGIIDDLRTDVYKAN